MEQRTAIIAGATGLVGRHLTEKLLNNEKYKQVIVFSRKAIDIQHQKLQQFIVDFDNLNYQKLPVNADDVFCALGTTMKKAGSKAAFRKVDHDYVINLARFAASVDAKRFLVVSAMGADANSQIFYNRVKGEMETDLSGMPLPEIHIFRPSLILGKRKEFRFGEYLAQKIAGNLAFTFVGALKKYRPIEASAIAKAMIIAAGNNKSGLNVYPSELMQKMHDSR